MKKNSDREWVQLDIGQPYFNYLKKEFSKKNIYADGTGVSILSLNAHHWLMQLVGQAVRLSPMDISVVLCEKRIPGVLRVNTSRYPYVKAVIEADYQNAFLNYYLHRKSRYRQTEIIRRWMDEYDLAESVNKYVKMFRRHNQKIGK